MQKHIRLGTYDDCAPEKSVPKRSPTVRRLCCGDAKGALTDVGFCLFCVSPFLLYALRDQFNYVATAALPGLITLHRLQDSDQHPSQSSAAPKGPSQSVLSMRGHPTAGGCISHLSSTRQAQLPTTPTASTNPRSFADLPESWSETSHIPRCVT